MPERSFGDSPQKLMEKKHLKHKQLKYIVLGFIFWFIVDWGTAGGFYQKYYKNILPLAIIIYSFFPLVFSFVIFRFNLRGKKLFLLTFFTALFSEIILFKNFMLLEFPKLFLFIPAALAIYSYIVFTPLWIIENRFKENKNKIIFFTILFILISILSIFTQK